MIKACIFDLDGTIADTLESMAYVANEIMEKFSLKPQPADNFRYYSGEGADMLIRRCLIDAGDPELVHYEEVRELYRRKFDEDPLYKVVPYKDMPETLQKLKHTGLKMAVCSNKPHVAAQKVLWQEMYRKVLRIRRFLPWIWVRWLQVPSIVVSLRNV